MYTFFSVIAVLYLLLLTYMYVFQRNLLYFPDRNIAEPSAYGLTGFDNFKLSTEDKFTVHLWYRPAEPGFPTILYFHGNASHVGNRAGIYAALAGEGFGVAALSYRGYGESEGLPTEQGLYEDARAAIAFLTDFAKVPLNRIVLYGESLGTGVAVQMGAEHDVGGVVLQAAYTSVAARAAEIYFYIPVNLLIKDRFDSLSKIGRVKAPLLFFHGELDTVIPIKQGKALFEAAVSPKRSFYFPDVSHNDFDSGVISAHVLSFVKEHRLIAP